MRTDGLRGIRPTRRPILYITTRRRRARQDEEAQGSRVRGRRSADAERANAVARLRMGNGHACEGRGACSSLTRCYLRWRGTTSDELTLRICGELQLRVYAGLGSRRTAARGASLTLVGATTYTVFKIREYARFS